MNDPLATSAATNSPSDMSDAEWQTRIGLAALYRLLDMYGMSDLANQEVGARITDQCALLATRANEMSQGLDEITGTWESSLGIESQNRVNRGKSQATIRMPQGLDQFALMAVIRNEQRCRSAMG